MRMGPGGNGSIRPILSAAANSSGVIALPVCARCSCVSLPSRSASFSQMGVALEKVRIVLVHLLRLWPIVHGFQPHGQADASQRKTDDRKQGGQSRFPQTEE